MISDVCPFDRDSKSRHAKLQIRVLPFVMLLVVSWCVMTLVHESGHLICGWFCGGTLVSADLLPWHLPYSIFEPDPKPLVTLGDEPNPIATKKGRNRKRDCNTKNGSAPNFCMLANGLYLATAWFTGDRYLDTTKLLEHGAYTWSIAVYCFLTIGAGYIGFRRQCVLVLSKQLPNVE